VKSSLRLGLTLRLLLAPTFPQRGTHDATTLLADPAPIVGDLLQALRGEQRIGAVRAQGVVDVVPVVAIRFAEVRILTHHVEYRPLSS